MKKNYWLFFICLSVDGHLDCFHVWVIVNSAAGNTGVHVSFWIIIVSGCGGGICCCCSVAQLCLTLCNPMGYIKHIRFPYPSPSPGACSDLCPLSWWCHPAISSSFVPFSSCLQSFPASESFPMSQLFASGGQSIGASASASVLPMNIQDWFPLGLSGLILQSKGLWRVFSNITIQKHQFFGAQPFYCPALTSIHDYWIILIILYCLAWSMFQPLPESWD